MSCIACDNGEGKNNMRFTIHEICLPTTTSVNFGFSMQGTPGPKGLAATGPTSMEPDRPGTPGIKGERGDRGPVGSGGGGGSRGRTSFDEEDHSFSGNARYFARCLYFDLLI